MTVDVVSLVSGGPPLDRPGGHRQGGTKNPSGFSLDAAQSLAAEQAAGALTPGQIPSRSDFAGNASSFKLPAGTSTTAAVNTVAVASCASVTDRLDGVTSAPDAAKGLGSLGAANGSNRLTEGTAAGSASVASESVLGITSRPLRAPKAAEAAGTVPTGQLLSDKGKGGVDSPIGQSLNSTASQLTNQRSGNSATAIKGGPVAPVGIQASSTSQSAVDSMPRLGALKRAQSDTGNQVGGSAKASPVASLPASSSRPASSSSQAIATSSAGAAKLVGAAKLAARGGVPAQGTPAESPIIAASIAKSTSISGRPVEAKGSNKFDSSGQGAAGNSSIFSQVSASQVAPNTSPAAHSSTGLFAAGSVAPPSNGGEAGMPVDAQLLKVISPLQNSPNGTSSLSIALQPLGLGQVQAHMVMSNGSIEVHLWASTQAGHDAISAGLSTLQEQLGGNGTNVTLANWGDRPPQGQPQTPQALPSQNSRHDSPIGAHEASSTAEIVSSGPRRLVDVRL